MGRPRPPFPPPTGVFSTHKANCHCKAVRWSFSISPPLDSYPVVSCNCSICERNGYLLVYPLKKNFTLEAGEEDCMASYVFANNRVKHSFCKKCGSSVFFDILTPPVEDVTLGPDKGEEFPDIMGVNVSSAPAFLDPLAIANLDG